MQPPSSNNIAIRPAAAPGYAAGSIFFSAAFWVTLAAAASVLAAVQLAPGLVRWQLAAQAHQQHARELQQLEHELQRLERLTATLAADPEFLAAVRAGEHSVAAARNQLSPTPAQLPAPADIATPANALPANTAFLLPDLRIPGFPELLHHTLLPAATRLAANPPLRHQLLWLAALLTIFAFTCLNDSGFHTACLVTSAPFVLIAQLWHRYRRIHQIPINPPEPVADLPVRIIMPEENRSDSSVGRATDS